MLFQTQEIRKVSHVHFFPGVSRASISGQGMHTHDTSPRDALVGACGLAPVRVAAGHAWLARGVGLARRARSRQPRVAPALPSRSAARSAIRTWVEKATSRPEELGTRCNPLGSPSGPRLHLARSSLARLACFASTSIRTPTTAKPRFHYRALRVFVAIVA